MIDTKFTLEGSLNTTFVSSGGTTNYNSLENKPSINNIELSGNKTLEELGIQPSGNYLTDETDPTIPNHVKNITEEDITNWNNKATETYVKNQIAEAQLSGGEVDLSGFATKDELNNKVDKVSGKSLISDTEIERLANITNYDDTELKEQINSKATISDMTNYIEEHKEDLKGADGKDGSNGTNGVDGISPTITSSKSGKVTTLTITDKNGTKTATINDGIDGADGKDGSDYVLTDADKTEIAEQTSSLINMNIIPDYVITGAETVIEKARQKQNENTITLMLGSDIHARLDHNYTAQMLSSTLHASQAMKLIREKLHVDCVGILGDTLWDNGETPEQAIEMYGIVHKYFSDAFCGIKQFWAKGNHDGLPSNSTPLTDAQIYSSIGIYNEGVIKPDKNRVQGYCYMDFPDTKLRLILMNTTETNDSYAVGTEQLQWLKGVLDLSSLGDGWNSIILSHCPLDQWGATSNVMSCIKNASGILCNIHGHLHNYKVDVLTGTEIPRIAIPNICFYRSNEYGQNSTAETVDGVEYGEETTYNKTANSAKDTAFCVVTIDRKANKLYADHYGAGPELDREVDLPVYSNTTVSYTNLLPTAEAIDSTEPYNGTGYKDGYYLSSEGSPYEGVDATTVITGYMPYTANTVNYAKPIYVKGAEWQEISHCRLYTFKETKINTCGTFITGTDMKEWTYEKLGDKYYKISPPDKYVDGTAAYVRLSLVGTGANLIITIDEPIE